jgi:hypothetical protein
MLTTTGVLSAALPVNDGVVLFEGEAGSLKVTTGAAVTTLNLTGGLVPDGISGSELG